MKVITEFSLVLILSKFTIIPFTGSLGELEQLTERGKKEYMIMQANTTVYSMQLT